MFCGWSKIIFASVYGFGLFVKTNFFGRLRWRQFGNISTVIRKKSELQEWRFFYSIDFGSLRLRKMVNPENELKSEITEKLLQLDEILSTNPLNRSNLILTGGNAKTFARLYPQVSANLRPQN